jgi:hypothetical protein
VYSSQDFVLASVGRLHEVVSGAGFGDMAGLNQVNVHGVEDVDMSEIVGGKFIQIEGRSRLNDYPFNRSFRYQQQHGQDSGGPACQSVIVGFCVVVHIRTPLV